MVLEQGGKWCKVADRVISQHPSDTRSGEIILRNRKILPGSNAQWAFDPGNILRLEKAQRLHLSDSGRLSAFVFWADVPRRRINNADYDGRTFCITQAFFPDKKAWDKIARALKGMIDEERFEKFSGTESLPFPAGEHARAAIKVIDPRGNEVMRVHDLKGKNR